MTAAPRNEKPMRSRRVSLWMYGVVIPGSGFVGTEEGRGDACGASSSVGWC